MFNYFNYSVAIFVEIMQKGHQVEKLFNAVNRVNMLHEEDSESH